MITKIIELDDKSYKTVSDLVDNAVDCICDIFETDNIIKHRKTMECSIEKLLDFLNSKCTKKNLGKPLESKSKELAKEQDNGFEEFEYLEKVCKSDPDNFDGVDEINHII